MGMPPTVVLIVDCTSHMSQGAKNDELYITEQFESKVNEIDQDRKLIDCFIIDGVSNVPTTGSIVISWRGIYLVLVFQ